MLVDIQKIIIIETVDLCMIFFFTFVMSYILSFDFLLNKVDLLVIFLY